MPAPLLYSEELHSMKVKDSYLFWY